MSSINRVILSGFTGGDPQITTLDNGTKVANFSLATSHPYKNKAGEKVEQTFWHRIVVFRHTADFVEKYVSKGSRLIVDGRLQSRVYEDKEGKKHTIVEIYPESIELLGSKPEGNNEAKAQQQANSAPDISGVNQDSDFPTAGSGSTDDLPF